MVEDKGRQIEKVTPFDSDTLEMEVMELAIEDLNIEEGTAEVYTSKTDFINVRKAIVEL
jgi:transcriptional/translational regulatory protein YebC/TACO1